MDALWCYTDCTAVFNGVKKRLSDHASRIEGPSKKRSRPGGANYMAQHPGNSR